jgi:hypothetical protein
MSVSHLHRYTYDQIFYMVNNRKYKIKIDKDPVVNESVGIGDFKILILCF